MKKYLKFSPFGVGCKKYGFFAKKCSFVFLNPYFWEVPLIAHVPDIYPPLFPYFAHNKGTKRSDFLHPTIAGLTRNLIVVFILLFNYSFIQSVSGQAASARSRSETSQQAHEFSVYGGCGLSSLRYSLSLSGDKVNTSGGFGGDFGIGYTRFFVSNWGVHTGAGLGLYYAKASLDGANAITPNLTDSDLDNFDMHTIMTGFNESQHAKFLNIPVMVQFQ